MTKTRLLALVLLTCLGGLPAGAGDGIPVIVMAEDSDPNSVRRSSDIFYRVIAETQELMTRYDFFVIDEHLMAGKLEWRVTDRRPREDMGELVELACTTGDVTLCPRAMTLLKIRAGAKATSFGTKVWVRLTGDVYDSASNANIGGWEPVRKEFPAPRDCTGICLEEVIGDHARDVAISLADVLRKKLAYLTRGDAGRDNAYGQDVVSTPYLFKFRYFEQKDILEITHAMETEFPCFEQVRGASGEFMNYTYNYVSCATINKLHEWMAILLSDMGHAEGTYKITLNGQREVYVDKTVAGSPTGARRTRRFN